MTDFEQDPSTDAVLHAIADSQRRIVLRELANEAGTDAVGSATDVAAGPAADPSEPQAAVSEAEPAPTSMEEPSTQCPDDASIEVGVELLEEAIARTRMARNTDFRSPTEIAIQLRHAHLPALEDVGLVRYYPERGSVEYCPNEFVESLLAFLETQADSPV